MNERSIDAVVFAKLKHDAIPIALHLGLGHDNSGFDVEVPLSLIAKELRKPSTRLSVAVQSGQLLRIGPADKT